MQIRLHLFAVLCSASMVLSACNSAVTNVPTISQAELEREQQVQEALTTNEPEHVAISASEEEAAKRLLAVTEKVSPAATQLCIDLGKASQECSFDVLMSNDSGINAYADGEKVVMFKDMIDFTTNDQELALVLAHEMAHNIMRHPQQQSQNATVGLIVGELAQKLLKIDLGDDDMRLGNIAAKTAVYQYSSDFEREADYVGMYVLKRSDYDLDNVAHFWRRMSSVNTQAIYTESTHPTNPERYIGINKTSAEIQRKVASNQPLLPNLAKD